jgi:hypothetical protein
MRKKNKKKKTAVARLRKRFFKIDRSIKPSNKLKNALKKQT